MKNREKDKKKPSSLLGRVWHFIWYEDSFASWIVNIILAFIIVKFIFYPGIGFLFGTGYPIVAVVSSSMEHKYNFEQWWINNRDFYSAYNITKEEFKDYSFNNGFNKGDIMVVIGKKSENINIGDVVVFRGSLRDPIIHRVIKKWNNSIYYFQTKGDNNLNSRADELSIGEERVLGKAVFRVPFLGWIKIIAVELINGIRSMV
ncbi:MAG: signal peptidase I [Nanoarchaeota archaeon]